MLALTSFVHDWRGPFGVTFYMVLAMFAYTLLVVGLIRRKKRKQHVLLMLWGMGIDIVLVLVLEFQRDAIGLALGAKSYTIYQYAHIIASVLAVIFYVPTMVYGFKRLKGRRDNTTLVWHIRMGLTAFTFRTLGLVLMFSFLQ